MNPLQFPNSAALLLAAEIQTYLAASTIDLYQAGMGIVLGPLTTKTELVAAKATFTGYAQQDITAWLDPLLAEGGGAAIDSGLNSFLMGAPYTTGNVLQGWWIEDAAANLMCCGDFAVEKAVVGAGDGVRFNVELILFG